MSVRPREEKTGAGVLIMALAVTLFTCIDTSAKWLTLAGLPVAQIVFMRYAMHFVMATLVYVPQEGMDTFRSRAPGKQFFRSLLLFSSTILNFLALKHLPITVTTSIFFAQPIIITLLAIPLLGEQVGIRRIIAVCVGFIGVLIVVSPWEADFHPAIFYSLGALVIASMYFIMTRMLAGVENDAVQQTWASGLAMLALMPFAIQAWIMPETPMQWLVLLGIGLFGGSGHIAATTAHRWADASILAPMVYTQIFLAAFAGIMVFDTYPTWRTLGGGIIIILSGLYIWQRERSKSKKKKAQPLATP